jgi:peptidoglycan/xylan/chitin deacetylase (PgdA/CDA1 family)
MRYVGGLSALVLCAALAAPLAAHAQQACTTPNALGVARTIDIDTTGGPWLGAPYGNPELLRPGEVVLTFDDGPIPLTTRPILAALAAECTKATFFMVGRMAAAYPQVVREVAAQGHTVGTHTWSHPNLGLASLGRTKAQIEAAISVVEKAAGVPIAPFFRYPYLSSTQASVAYLRSRSIAQFAVDIDSFDYRTRNPQNVVGRIMAQIATQRRGIILLHDIHASTARAVPDLLARLKEKGIKIVHLRPKAPVESLQIAVADAEGLAPEKSAAPRRRPLRRPARIKAAKSQDTGGPPSWLPW